MYYNHKLWYIYRQLHVTVTPCHSCSSDILGQAMTKAHSFLKILHCILCVQWFCELIRMDGWIKVLPFGGLSVYVFYINKARRIKLSSECYSCFLFIVPVNVLHQKRILYIAAKGTTKKTPFHTEWKINYTRYLSLWC